MPGAQPYWDAAGEYEDQTTIYTITVFVLPRPPSKFLPSIITREPVYASPHHVIRPDNSKPNYDSFTHRDLQGMKTKAEKVQARDFPHDLRCKHVQEGAARMCREGCYVLEKGGDVRRWTCNRGDCEGHVYSDPVKGTKEEWKCFGKKGERIAALK